METSFSDDLILHDLRPSTPPVPVLSLADLPFQRSVPPELSLLDPSLSISGPSTWPSSAAAPDKTQEITPNYNSSVPVQTVQNVDQARQFRSSVPKAGPNNAAATNEGSDQPRQYRFPEGGPSNTSPVPLQTGQGSEQPKQHFSSAVDAGTNYSRPASVQTTSKGIDPSKQYNPPSAETRTKYTSPTAQNMDQPKQRCSPSPEVRSNYTSPTPQGAADQTRQRRSPAPEAGTNYTPATPLKTVQGIEQLKQRRNMAPESAPCCAASRNRTSSSDRGSQRSFTAQDLLRAMHHKLDEQTNVHMKSIADTNRKLDKLTEMVAQLTCIVINNLQPMPRPNMVSTGVNTDRVMYMDKCVSTDCEYLPARHETSSCSAPMHDYPHHVSSCCDDHAPPCCSPTVEQSEQCECRMRQDNVHWSTQPMPSAEEREQELDDFEEPPVEEVQGYVLPCPCGIPHTSLQCPKTLNKAQRLYMEPEEKQEEEHWFPGYHQAEVMTSYVKQLALKHLNDRELSALVRDKQDNFMSNDSVATHEYMRRYFPATPRQRGIPPRFQPC